MIGHRFNRNAKMHRCRVRLTGEECACRPSSQLPQITTGAAICAFVVLLSGQPALSQVPATSGVSVAQRIAVANTWFNSAGYYPPLYDEDFAELKINPLDVLDIDDDGLDGMQEAWVGTDPEKADTDGDGALDGIEVNADIYLGLQPTNPLNRNDIPVRPYIQHFLNNLVAGATGVSSEATLFASNPPADVAPSGGSDPGESNEYADSTMMTPLEVTAAFDRGQVLDDSPIRESVPQADSLVAAAGFPTVTATAVATVIPTAFPTAFPTPAVDDDCGVDFKTDPLLYKTDAQLAGEGHLPGSIYWKPCQSRYKYKFLNFGSIPVSKRDLHHFGGVVGMQAWLEIVRQVMPMKTDVAEGSAEYCPDIITTKMVDDQAGANVTFQYIGASSVCDTSISSANPTFARIRMASWSEFWTYLHELGHAVGLGHTTPLKWSTARANEYSTFGSAPWVASHCPLMSYGHLSPRPKWIMPKCVGHPNDEQRARAFHAQRLQKLRGYVCGKPIACKLNKKTNVCVPTLPAGANPGDYEDALHRPCWPKATPKCAKVLYGEWFKDEYRCSNKDWRLLVTFVPINKDSPHKGQCFVGIGTLTADGKDAAEWFRRGIGAFWIPKDAAGKVIPLAKRTRANCGLKNYNTGEVL